MSTEIYTPTAEQLDARIARFDQLTPMSTTDDLAWVPREAWEIFFAQKIMAVILEPLWGQSPDCWSVWDNDVHICYAPRARSVSA